MNVVAKELGFSSATDVLGTEPAKKKARSDVVPVYRNPESHDQAYCKPGREPAWINEPKDKKYAEEHLKAENQQ
jgi:DNA-binding protein H-NS